MFVYPYKSGSKSVAALKEALGARIIRLENSSFRGNQTKIVINWGNSMENEEVEKAMVLNTPSAVKKASNKRTFFELCENTDVNIPAYTTDKSVAEGWLDDGGSIIIREKLTGHSGEGIVLLTDQEGWDGYNHSRSKLYVKYIPKRDEFRVHVVNGEVIDTQQKARSSRYSDDQVNWQIRNHSTGFIYKREDVNPDTQVHEQAILAVEAAGLHFGAVDVIWNEYRKAAYVLEINTAPGLEGQTIESYAEALSRLRVEIENGVTTVDVANDQLRTIRRREESN